MIQYSADIKNINLCEFRCILGNGICCDLDVYNHGYCVIKQTKIGRKEKKNCSFYYLHHP